MIKAIKSLLSELESATSEEPLSEGQTRLASAALMVEIAQIDEDFSDTEIETLKSELARTYQLSDAEQAQLLDSAESEQEQAVSLHQFTSLLNQSLNHSQKFELLISLWRVAYADNELDKYEEHLIRRICELLYLSHSDFIKAKQKAKNG